MSARDNGTGVLPRAGRRLPALVAIGAAIPALTGLSGAQAAGRRPSVVLCTGYASCQARGYSDHGYPAHAAASYWRMTAGNECTNYVAYVEHRAFGAAAPRYLLGNAGQWAATAAAHGVAVNHVPSAGAVAEWDGGTHGMGAAGHVAVVEKVGPRARYIVISQQHIGSSRDGYDWTRINAGFGRAAWQEWPSHFLHFTGHGGGAVGYYNPRAGTWRLQLSLGASRPVLAFRRRHPGAIPLTGDWDGRGADGIGYYLPATGRFLLRDRPGGGAPTRSFTFGPPHMVPLAGNWDGRGGSGVGYYDPATGTFHLRDYLSHGRAEHAFSFGPPHMVPLAGNWDGRGGAGVGYYNPATGRFYLRNRPSAGPPSVAFSFGPPRMRPLAGNWGGRRGDRVGYYNPRSGWFHLRGRLSAGPAAEVFRFGPPGMVPLAGEW